MKWWVLALSLFCLSMAVFPEVAQAGGRDSDGDGTPDVGKQFVCLFFWGIDLKDSFHGQMIAHKNKNSLLISIKV